jgi:hypothetical protein
MKTAGTSLLYQIRANVAEDAMWGAPDVELDEFARMARYSSVEQLRSLDPETRSRLRVVMGHLPFAVVDVGGFDHPMAATVVRDPVGRVLSHLQMCRSRNDRHRGLPLEAIYEDELLATRLLRDHQTKMLGMTSEQACARPTPTEPPPDPAVVARLRAEGYFDSPQFLHDLGPALLGTMLIDTPMVWPIPVDGSMLDNARRNLDRVDVLGLHEDFDRFLDRLGRRMGWTMDHGIRINRGQAVRPSASFRRRIEEGNALDLELYEHARSLVARH